MQNEVTGDMLFDFLADTIKGVPIFSTAWTNPEPNEAYTPASVTVGEHDAVLIVFKMLSTNNREVTAFVENGMEAAPGITTGAAKTPYMMVRYRPLTYADGVITFDHGYLAREDTAEGIADTVIIPLRIYSIDFIGGGNKLKTFLSRLLKGGERRG